MTNPTLPPTDDLDAALESLLSKGASPEEFTRQLFYLNYERFKSADPELAEMMRACAIPRVFNADIIGVLRGASDDETGNQTLLEGLLPFNFVLARQDGGYIYHDNTRQMLLADWQQPANQPLFQTYQERLAAFYVNQGQAAFQQADYAAALANYNRALELRPADGELYGRRGRAHLNMGNYPAAKNDLEKAISLDFNPVDTYFGLGVAHYYLGDYTATVHDFSKVIEQEPNNASAFYNRGTTYGRDLKQFEQALADYDRA
ncbi:MAG: tetratricopeptide repeat protein, partial [Anaerolineae bacterium]|nr:tetratricopeptide repeat protein [Anaerolineae bacterium]